LRTKIDKNRKKIEEDFEVDLLMIKELTALCTENGAPKFFI